MTDQEKSYTSYVSDLLALEEHMKQVIEAEHDGHLAPATSQMAREASDHDEGPW
jgi:hypothetical protein